MYTTDLNDLKFQAIEVLRKRKRKLCCKLELVFENDMPIEEYRSLCLEILNEYRSIIEKFNKSIEANINYIEKVFIGNLVGKNNKYLVDMKVYLQDFQTKENKIFEEIEDKTWRIERTSKNEYLLNCKYELKKGLEF